jgi:hypothetical protein
MMHWRLLRRGLERVVNSAGRALSDIATRHRRDWSLSRVRVHASATTCALSSWSAARVPGSRAPQHGVDLPRAGAPGAKRCRFGLGSRAGLRPARNDSGGGPSLRRSRSAAVAAKRRAVIASSPSACHGQASKAVIASPRSGRGDRVQRGSAPLRRCESQRTSGQHPTPNAWSPVQRWAFLVGRWTFVLFPGVATSSPLTGASSRGRCRGRRAGPLPRKAARISGRLPRSGAS